MLPAGGINDHTSLFSVQVDPLDVLDRTSYSQGCHTVSSSTESRMFAEVIIEILRNRLWSVICKNHNNTDEQGSQWQQEAPCCYGGAFKRAKIRSSFRRRFHGKRARTGDGNMWTRDLGRRRETGPRGPGAIWAGGEGTSGLGDSDQSTRLKLLRAPAVSTPRLLTSGAPGLFRRHLFSLTTLELGFTHWT